MSDDQGTPAGPVRDVEYKGGPLDSERGPGLGCFWVQVAILVVFIVLTPLSVRWNWPPLVSGILLFVVIGLLLLTGQTIIFLLRLVAADRRGRRRPLASASRTVGELEDASLTEGGTPEVADDTGRAESTDPGDDTGPEAETPPARDGAGFEASTGPEDAPPGVRE